MGQIHKDVYNFWNFDRTHEPLLRAFLNDFGVTWAKGYTKYGASITVYFLRPEESTKQSIGFDREVALVVSSYPTLHASTLQAADAFLSELPAAGRVESLAYVLAAPVPSLLSEVRSYLSENRQSRLIVPFTWEELKSPSAWFIRSRFTESLTARDLFDMQQPLATDTYYFGRSQLVTDLLDRFRNGENSGLFGLRKTGKTSAVFKLRRQIESSQEGISVYVDAQNPDTYRLRWWELIERFASGLASQSGIGDSKHLKTRFRESDAGKRLQALAEQCLSGLPAGRQRVLLIVDEIEHIVPQLRPTDAEHWDSDFMPLWKTLRAIQTTNRNLTFLVVGVNAGAVETPSIERQDNPLFSLVGIRYMPSFGQEEVREMVRTIGRPMGMRFEEAAYAYLHARYGGHPSLTRLACSWYHKRAIETKQSRPFVLSTADLQTAEEAAELTLLPHVNHILEVLRLWYPDEYDMLQLLAQGDIVGFTELAEEAPELRHHLDQYGLLATRDGVPALRIAVIGKYLRTRSRNQPATDGRSGGTEWLDIVTDISRLRNTLEPKLRRYIRRTLKAHLGSERWIDPVLKALPSERAERLKGVDRDEILSDRLFLSDLIQVVEANWDKYFKSLESSTKHKLEKGQFSTLARYVNAHRPDAHAKDVTQSERLTVGVICETLNLALDEALED